jgi:hypothetical protein
MYLENKFFRMCQALKLCPWASTFNAQLLSNRGACNLKLNNYDKVIEDCSAALDLLPGYVKALLHRARAYLQANKNIKQFSI